MIQETADAVTIVFKQPALKKISYLSGQYLSLIFRINGRQYIRPYSFSSAPQVDANIHITVKRVPGGVVSNHIVDKLKVDDVVEVIEPIGDFTIEKDFINADTHLLFWGAGSGITPLISIIKYALAQNIGKHVTLIYGNRDSGSTLFNAEIEELRNKYSSKFDVFHFHTRFSVESSDPNTIKGRIDPVSALSIINNLPDTGNAVNYICGPKGLKESVKEALARHNFDMGKVLSEDFEVVRDPKEFENVVTADVSIKKSGEQFNVEVVKGHSVLNACLDALVELPYSCQTGNCLICKGRLLSGELKVIGAKKADSDLLADEYLLCCSFPLTPNVEIEVE